MSKPRKKFIHTIDFCESILNRADKLANSSDERRVIASHRDTIHQLKNIIKQALEEPAFDFKSVIRAQSGG